MLGKKSCKLLENTTFKHEKNVLDGVKVFKAVLDLEEGEHPVTQKFVIGKNIAERHCKEIYLKDKDVYFLIGNEEKKLNLNELYDFCYKIETLAMCILHEPEKLSSLSKEIYGNLYIILKDEENYFE